MRRESEDVGKKIRRRFAETRARIVRGWVPRKDFIPQKRRDEAAAWLKAQYKNVRSAMRDEDNILFERAVVSWEKGFEKINTICGEAYRERYPDPEEWPLRYFRWMKVQYMEFECDLGTFYIVPRRPRRKPKVDHWMTADEMIDILENPAMVKAIKEFGLPVRGDTLPGPRPNEKHLVCDFRKEEPQVYYKF